MSTGLDSGSDLLCGDLTAHERHVLAAVDGALDEGLELYRWWRRREAKHHIEHVPLVRQLNSPDWNYGLFAEAPLRRGLLPVLGVVQGTFYDQPKVPASRQRINADWYRAQVQEFALRYFLRTSWAPLPRFVPSTPRERDGDRRPAVHGWAFQQVFYKLQASGEIGRFPAAERFRIVDLRRLFDQYEWIILKVRLYSFTLDKTFLGANGPRLRVPLLQDVWVVAHRDLCSDCENPEPGMIGEYGGGWAVIPVPDPDSVLAYGPQHLGTTFEFIHFQVLEDGQVWVKVAFVSSRPNRVFNIEPIQWSLRLAEAASLGTLSPALNPIREALATSRLLPAGDPMQMFMSYCDTLTGGVAARELCISRSQLYRDIMVAHFIALFQFILRTIPTWSQVPNWLDEQALPDWVNGYRPPPEESLPQASPHQVSAWGPMPPVFRTRDTTDPDRRRAP